MREPMVFVCEASHPLVNRRRVKLADLAGHDFIKFPPGWGIRQRLDKGFAAAGVHPISAYEVADYAITAELIRHRLATTILPASVASRFPDLRTSSATSNHDLDAINRVRRHPRHENPAINALVDTLVRHVG